MIETESSATDKADKRHNIKNATSLDKLVGKVIPAMLKQVIVFKPVLISHYSSQH